MPLPPDFEKRLWDAADQLWTNSTLLPSQYSTPVLALIFLKYADHRFAQAEKELTGGRRREIRSGRGRTPGIHARLPRRIFQYVEKACEQRPGRYPVTPYCYRSFNSRRDLPAGQEKKPGIEEKEEKANHCVGSGKVLRNHL